MPYLNVTTHIAGRKHEGLVKEKSGRAAFPTILFLDHGGGVVAKPSARTVEAFDKTLTGDVSKFVELQKKAASGDPVAVVDFALLEGALGRITLKELEERLADSKLNDAQKKSLERVRALGTFEKAQQTARAGRGSPEACRKALDMLKPYLDQGIDPENLGKRQGFYQFLAQCALRAKDPRMAQQALDRLKPLLPKDNPRVAPWVQRMQDAIDGLKSSGTEEETEEPEDEEGGIEEGG